MPQNNKHSYCKLCCEQKSLNPENYEKNYCNFISSRLFYCFFSVRSQLDKLRENPENQADNIQGTYFLKLYFTFCSFQGVYKSEANKLKEIHAIILIILFNHNSVIVPTLFSDGYF